jgi:hypothetical protein
MTTDPRETPQTREEKLAATSRMYSTADIKGTDGVTSYFTKEIDKDQAAERLALPALWETFSYDRTLANFDAYRDAYLAVNGSFPYDHLRPTEELTNEEKLAEVAAAIEEGLHGSDKARTTGFVGSDAYNALDARRCELEDMIAEAASPTLYIGFNNNGGKMHGTYRCGMSRTNKVHNTPFIVPLEAEHACKRCGGPSTVASMQAIEDAWTETYRGSQRSPWGGMDEAYTVTEMMRMQERFAASQEA